MIGTRCRPVARAAGGIFTKRDTGAEARLTAALLLARERNDVNLIRFDVSRGELQAAFLVLPASLPRSSVCWLTRAGRMARIEESKGFLVLFFKKELLPPVASARSGRIICPASWHWRRRLAGGRTCSA
jgi:hypothetical protein